MRCSAARDLFCGTGGYRTRHRINQPGPYICRLIVLHFFSIMLIMHIVKRREAEDGLFASTKG
jgi:hypothetical protein